MIKMPNHKTKFLKILVLFVSLFLASEIDAVIISWNSTTDLPANRWESAAVVSNGRIYLTGGAASGDYGTNTVYRGDISSDGTITSWATYTMNLSRTRHGAVVCNNYLYVIGGLDEDRNCTDTVAFAQISSSGTLGTWQTTTALPALRYSLSATVWNNRIYITGGNDEYNVPTNTIYIATPGSDGKITSWTTSATTLPAKRSNHVAIAYNSWLYIIGGGTADGGSTNGSSTNIYKTQINTDGTISSFSSATDLLAKRARHGAFISGEKMYIMGGWSGVGAPFDTTWSAPVNADGTLGVISSETVTLPEVRYYFGFCVNPSDNRKYILGGASGTGSTIINSVCYSGSPPSPGVAACSNVTSSIICSSWTANGNPGDTNYVVWQSSWTGGFTGTVVSSTTPNVYADFTDLSPNTTYWYQVKAVRTGQSSVWTSLGTTVTLCSAANGAVWDGITETGVTVSWTDTTQNSTNTIYIVNLSTVSNFTGELHSSQTTKAENTATISSLSPNTTYYGRMITRNWENQDTSADLSPAWKATLANIPGAASFSNVTSSVIRSSWTANGNSDGTTYVVEQSSWDGFTGTVAAATTTLNYADFTGLAPNTTYWYQVKAVNYNGQSSNFVSLGTKATLCSAPNGLDWGAIFVSSVTVNWTDTTDNPSDTVYIVDLSTASDFTGTIYSSQTIKSANTAMVSSLIPNTTYYGRVAASSWENQDTSADLSPACMSTLSPVPGPASFSDVTEAAIRSNWTPNGNSDGTTYVVEQSSWDGFTGTVAVATTTLNYADFTGLAPNTTYWHQVKAISYNGQSSSFVSLGTKVTLCSAPDGLSWGTVGETGIAVDWTDSTANPLDTVYIVELSFASDFTGDIHSSQITKSATTATISSLIQNTTYYGRVVARNWENQDVVSLLSASTATLSAVPGASSFSNVTANAIHANWTANGNSDGTTYAVEQSSWNGFTGTVVAATTLNHYADFTGLAPNTTYWYQVKAVNYEGQSSSFVSLNTKATLCEAMNGLDWGTICESSITVNWTDTTDNPSDTIYIVELSTSNNFIGTIYSSQTIKSANTATVSSLIPNTTYYGRVAVYNRENQSVLTNLVLATATLCTAPNGLSWGTNGVNSIAVDWIDTTDNPLDTIYIVELSSASDFTGNIYSSQTIRVANTATVSSLTPGQYYGRVLRFHAGTYPENGR